MLALHEGEPRLTTSAPAPTDISLPVTVLHVPGRDLAREIQAATWDAAGAYHDRTNAPTIADAVRRDNPYRTDTLMSADLLDRARALAAATDPYNSTVIELADAYAQTTSELEDARTRIAELEKYVGTQPHHSDLEEATAAVRRAREHATSLSDACAHHAKLEGEEAQIRTPQGWSDVNDYAQDILIALADT